VALPRSAVLRALDAMRPALEQCYRVAAAGAQRDAGGSLAASVVIDVDGQATQVTVAPFALGDFSACARQTLGRGRPIVVPAAAQVVAAPVAASSSPAADPFLV